MRSLGAGDERAVEVEYRRQTHHFLVGIHAALATHLTLPKTSLEGVFRLSLALGRLDVDKWVGCGSIVRQRYIRLRIVGGATIAG